MNEAKSILTFLQITWKSMCRAELSDLRDFNKQFKETSYHAKSEKFYKAF